MQRFYWLIEGAIAGCSLPGGPDGARQAPDALARDLEWLRDRGIGALVSLTESPLPPDALAAAELRGLHVPVPDLTAPTPSQFTAVLQFIDCARSRGEAVAVHCLMGQGRTGAILASHLIRGGHSARDAIDQLRSICTGALGSASQEHALEVFAARRDWIL